MFFILIKAKEPNFSIFGYKHMIGMAIYVLAGAEFNTAVAYHASFIASYSTRNSAHFCVDFLLTFHTTRMFINTFLQNLIASEKKKMYFIFQLRIIIKTW